MDVKIIEPIKHFIKEFNTPEEFNMWYKMNSEDMDKLTTHKLNKLYHITGYRITKIKGELMLKEDKKIKDEEIKSDDLPSKIISLENEIVKIKSTVNKLIEIINSTFQGTIKDVDTE